MSVDVEVIDRQHQRLFALIGRLREAMSRGEGNSVLREIVEGLVEYANIHFATEEGYFEASAYPDSDSHKQQHRDFVTKVTDFKQGFEDGRLMLTLDVMDFVSDWLVDHIQGSDASYAPFLDEGTS
jgi:hemerythrin-like metal-binding protein